MKSIFISLVLVANFCAAQKWQAGLMVGGANYTGDLNKRSFELKSTRPLVGLDIRYDLYNVVLRGGITWAKVAANDKNNPIELSARNLNFQSNILEGQVGIEINVLEPDYWAAYPYIFGGVGFFHFNPYTFDENNKKTFLRPLSTEGQGLSEYPDRKPYKLNEFCIPFGAGFKFNVNDRMTIAYEFGYRVLFTDYLDDVSKRFIDEHTLLAAKGPKAVELAFRRLPTPPGQEVYDKVNNSIRGNPKVKDGYFFNGIKLIFDLSSVQ